MKLGWWEDYDDSDATGDDDRREAEAYAEDSQISPWAERAAELGE